MIEFLMVADAPTPVAPFSHATAADGWLFVTGQMPTEPADDSAPLPDGIEAQTRRVIDNLKIVLAGTGSGLDRVVKTTVFLQSLDDFPGMNEVYKQHVGDQPPARSTVEVAKLPSGALVEIEAIALA